MILVAEHYSFLYFELTLLASIELSVDLQGKKKMDRLLFQHLLKY